MFATIWDIVNRMDSGAIFVCLDYSTSQFGTVTHNLQFDSGSEWERVFFGHNLPSFEFVILYVYNGYLTLRQKNNKIYNFCVDNYIMLCYNSTTINVECKR